MRTFKSIAAYAAEMDKAERELNIERRRQITRAQAKKAQGIADRAAMADLGADRAFSGWRRGAPIALDTQIRDGRNGATLLTPTRSSAGPWTVAQDGRNQGQAGGFMGPGVNTRTGLTGRTKSGALRKVRSRRARRWNGRTVGKHTADDARAIMERELPKVADKEFGVVLRKHFDVD